MNGQVLVVTNSTLNTKESVGELTLGELGIFGIDSTTLKTVKASPGASLENFFLAVGVAKGLQKVSRSLTKGRLRTEKNFQLEKWMYRAPVNGSFNAAINCLGSGAFDNFTLKIDIRYGEGFSGQEIQQYSFHATGKFLTPLALYQAIKADSDATVQTDVVITASESGVQVTGTHPSQVITISLVLNEEEIGSGAVYSECTADVTELISADMGKGTYAQLQRDLRLYGIWDGKQWINDREVPIVQDANASASTASTFNIYYLRASSVPSEGKAFEHGSEFFIYVRSDAVTTQFDATLESVTGQSIKIV